MSPQLVSYESQYLEFNGANLLYKNNSRVQAILTSNVTSANLTTKAINVTFYVANSVFCSIKRPPYGTVLANDISDNKFVIRDMIYNGCQTGSLYANIYLWRGIKNPQTGEFTNLFVSNYLDFYVGDFGCDASCIRCNGTTNTSCLLCTAYDSMYLSNGSCLS